jgi:hypothetical protein
MKNRIISGAVVVAMGLLIALGPQFLFKVCRTSGHGFLRCHWSAQGEIGIGFLIAALGIALFVFTEQTVRLGLTIGVGFSSIIALCIPHALIGGCGSVSMACRKIAFPSITIISFVLLALAVANAVYLAREKKER